MSDPEVVCNFAKDMISDLPGNVIERILECMPLQDAVRTSILSKKWRYNWATLPQLVFDGQFFDYAIDDPWEENVLANNVNEVLLLHIGPIHKFSLCIPDSCSIQNRDIARWILILSRNGIRELTLVNSKQNNSYRLPSYLFSCQQLTHLKLHNYTFKPPPAFRAFHNIRSLELKSITFATNIFESLISSSPLLERFIFVSCNGVDHFNIDAPNLKYLFVSGMFKSVSFISTPKLVEVSFIMTKFPNHSALKMANLDEVMGCLPQLEKLHLSRYSLKVLAAGGVPKRLATTSNFLKYLKFCFLDFYNVDQISCALCLIRSSINLQELEILAFASPAAAMEPVLNFMENQDCADCTLDQLRKVTMQRVRGSKPELEFMEYFLACSPILDLMLIERHKDIDANAELRMSRELMRFSRASPKAQIIYLDPPTENAH
uniref:F-box domain-containing protein n=1 Tax=Davidia involucrata TaxID=16924 RepID=A0A5B7BWP8_DAVIN